MKLALSIALVLLGILTAIVLAAPKLVVLGYFFLIVPGLILTAIPTVFAYLAATVLIRLIPGMPAGNVAYLLSLILALLLGWVVMQPFRYLEIAKYQQAIQPDVAPASPVSLRGDIRMEEQVRFARREEEAACDHVCAPILDLPGVRSLTVVRGESAARFALVPSSQFSGTGVFPRDPGRFILNWKGISNFKERETAGKALEAQWALRLAGDERLVAQPAASESPADWVIQRIQTRNPGEPRVSRVEILDLAGGGSVRFRKSYVEHDVPAPIFHFGFQGGSSSDGFGGARFHVGRKTLKSGASIVRDNAESVLIEAIGLSIPTPNLGLPIALRAAAERALRDPSAAPARVDLARRWLSLFWFNAQPADYALIALTVGDERIRDLNGPLKNVFRKDKTPVAMRQAYAERILMAHTSPKDRLYLARALASMPPGTFRNPTAAHTLIWTDAEHRLQAAPFLAAAADLGGEKGVAVLLNALEAAVPLEPWNKKRESIKAIQDGFIRLGPEAAPAIPRIRELFLMRPSPITHNSGDADSWRLALARMGVAIDDLPFYPNQGATMTAQIKKKIRSQLARYEREAARTPAD
ncbi:MAG: hypothetical protein U5J83_02325 [Bryobacterales bacterium]|nr:hypothetical protein [Bryobacterales bacterium]